MRGLTVAEQYPARTDSNGRTWYRPVRPAGMDMSQWGWTSQREQAHPDYRALADEQTGGLHPVGLCGGDCSGCVSEGEGAAPYRWGNPLREVGAPALVVEPVSLGIAARVEAYEAPVVAAVAVSSIAYGEALGALWAMPVDDPGAEWSLLGFVDKDGIQ